MNLATIIERHPAGSVALSHAGRQLTYGELRAQAGAIRRHLSSSGVAAGDRVALLLPTSPSFVVAYFGTLGIGAVAVPLNPASPLAELERELEKVKPSAVLVGGRRGAEVKGALEERGHRVWTLTPIGRVEAGEVSEAGEVLDAGEVSDAPDVPVGPDTGPSDPQIVVREPDATAVLLFTSGTAGTPKAAMLTHGNMLANIEQMELSVGLAVTADDVGVLVVPPFHIFGLNAVLGVHLFAGGRLVLMERFDPAEMLELISSEKVTILVAVPQLFAALAAIPAAAPGTIPAAAPGTVPAGAPGTVPAGAPGTVPAAVPAEGRRPGTPEDDGAAASAAGEPVARTGAGGGELASVRLACSGAAPLPLDTALSFESRFGVPVWQGYGLTEASPAVTFPDLGAPHRPSSVGLALPGIELRIADVDGHDVEAGDPGEILVRGPNVFAGYLDDAEATARAVDRGGWLHTGDVAVMSDDGSLTLVDRTKDLVIVSGFNVFPAEVEQVLEAHPAVAEAAVVGVPDAAHGETVRAFVVPQPGTWPDGAEAPEVITEADLISHASRLLARYKCPTSVTFVRELPHGLQGKVVRRALH